MTLKRRLVKRSISLCRTKMSFVPIEAKMLRMANIRKAKKKVCNFREQRDLWRVLSAFSATEENVIWGVQAGSSFMAIFGTFIAP